MRIFLTTLCLFSSIAVSISAHAGEAKFNGSWSVDLRSSKEKKQRVECGTAGFTLVQKGNKISGSHSSATPGCGRLDEGDEGSVKGVVVGETAVLTVTSSRNGEIVLGKATRSGAYLDWQTIDIIKAGEPGDTSLILHKARLTRE